MNYGFTIRGQEFSFQTREEYLEAFSKALDIAKEQEEYVEEQVELPKDSAGKEYSREVYA